MTGVHVVSRFEHETFTALQYYKPEILDCWQSSPRKATLLKREQSISPTLSPIILLHREVAWNLLVVGSCSVLRLHQSALWRQWKSSRTSMIIVILGKGLVLFIQPRTVQRLYRHQFHIFHSTKLYERVPRNWLGGKSNNIQLQYGSSLRKSLLSSLVAASDVSPGEKSAPPRQKFQTNDVNDIYIFNTEVMGVQM